MPTCFLCLVVPARFEVQFLPVNVDKQRIWRPCASKLLGPSHRFSSGTNEALDKALRILIVVLPAYRHYRVDLQLRQHELSLPRISPGDQRVRGRGVR